MGFSPFFQPMEFSLPSPQSSLPQPPGCCLCWEQILTQVVPGPLAVKQSRGGVHICPADLPALPLAGMAPAVNNLLLRDKWWNSWSTDQNAVCPILTGRFTCLASVLFFATCFLTHCPLHIMSCPFLTVPPHLFVLVFYIHTPSIYFLTV